VNPITFSGFFKRFFQITACMILTNSNVAIAGMPSSGSVQSRADSHAPIGVMGDHMHDAGEFMLSYRFMSMRMDGNRDGTSSTSTSQVLSQFMMSPLEMDMKMHMVGGMWAPTDNVTLSVMVPFVEMSMKIRNRMGAKIKTRSRGIGDVKLNGLFRLRDWHSEFIDNRIDHHLHLNLGVSLPTGSINKKDATFSGRVRLPYPMQIGSGTYDFLPGITYSGSTENYSFGAQLRSTLRTGINNKSYSLGHRFGSSIWLQRLWGRSLSTSLGFHYEDWGNIRGDDDVQSPMMTPTADSDRRAGRTVNASVGANWLFIGGPFDGHRFGAELNVPVYRNLDGPQLETDLTLVVGWQKAW